MDARHSRYATTSYDPLKAGSIDGTDTIPHDRAVCRALCATHTPPRHLPPSDPLCTLFVGRLPRGIKERQLETCFTSFADVKHVTIVRDIVTGFEKGYAFVGLERREDVDRVLDECQGLTIEGKKVLVDREVGRTLKGWVPRRLGGGWGGKREAGQLRFGCLDRPWKRPIEVAETKQFREQSNKKRKQ